MDSDPKKHQLMGIYGFLGLALLVFTVWSPMLWARIVSACLYLGVVFCANADMSRYG